MCPWIGLDLKKIMDLDLDLDLFVDMDSNPNPRIQIRTSLTMGSLFHCEHTVYIRGTQNVQVFDFKLRQ